MMFDVVIVGAGAAGIAAGRILATCGVSFIILEASPRIGGRAHTDRSSLPGQWEQGCQWFHCADVNPLVPVAETLGWDFEREDRTGNDGVFLDGRWQGAQDLADWGQHLEAAFAAIYRAGRAGLDRPIAEILPDSGKWQPFVRSILQLLSSEDPERLSARGYADYADTEQNWIVTAGLGALVERLAQGLPIRTGVAVLAIDDVPEGLRIETSAGVIEARSAIVTASTNLILSGAIRFGSASVRPVLDLMQGLPCGTYEKVALAFDRLPLDPGNLLFLSVQPQPGDLPLGFQIVNGPQPKLIAHIGGSAARDLAGKGAGAMVDCARAAIGSAFGGKAPQGITAAAVTGWSANPWVRGAYSYALPGHGQSRKAMIAANTHRLRFAGEAFSLPWHSTVHGAWQSGCDAARDLAAELGPSGGAAGWSDSN
jgi:monoamine oxidase